MRQIFTIGYEDADLTAVIDALEARGVTMLVDIRAVAVSRRPGFSKTALSARLREEGIEYRHLRDLGDPKPGRDAARAGHIADFKLIYTEHLDTQLAAAAMAQLAQLAVTETACLLCYEREAQHCHRTLVAARLRESMAISVVDLQPAARVRTAARTLTRPDQGGTARRLEAW